MDAILSQIVAALSGSGPWGVLIGVAVMLLYRSWKNRAPNAPSDPNAPLLAALMALLRPPAAPKQPDAKPDAPAIPDQHRGPLLDALLKALGGKQ